MRVVDSQDRRISCLREWESRIFSKPSKKRHWKPGRSAYSLADFIMNPKGKGVAHLESRISSILKQSVTLEEATPEYLARFDCYKGNPSNLDLGITGRVGSKSSLFIGVEAKVDEPFGPTVSGRYGAAIKLRDSGKSTNADKRIVDLLSHYFSETNDPCSSKFASVRYQLLTATAGTVAVGKDISVFYVLVFKTCMYDECKGSANQQDYKKFMQVAGGKLLLQDGEGFHAHELTLNGKRLICIYDHVSIQS